MKNDTLKKLAINAKNRLIRKSGGIVGPATTDNVTYKLIYGEDEAFFEKVRNLLQENSITPIKELMDKNKYESLDPFGKQKYLLDTIEKFQEIKRRIETENSRKFVY